jgi:hypothetical protein
MLRPERGTMARHKRNINTSQAVIAEPNRSIDVINAEISARTSGANYGESAKRERRFISTKAAALSEAAEIARDAARQLAAARTRVLDEVARAETAGFFVQDDFSVSDPCQPMLAVRALTDMPRPIQAAVADLRTSSRLQLAVNALKDLSDN